MCVCECVCVCMVSVCVSKGECCVWFKSFSISTIPVTHHQNLSVYGECASV